MKLSDSAVAPSAPHAIVSRGGVLAWIRHALQPEAPSREEIRRRVRSKPGIFDSLSPEALEYLRDYDGPENSGPPLTWPEHRKLA
jgi:hypothetical protein